ncbi:hypothetical protein V7157_11980 [Neobacillus drentensis]|uniref:hypothetical protein n=1 Tax=Neobacillus drentensis TaxID=220684 RepID=UPI002FFDEFF0
MFSYLSLDRLPSVLGIQSDLPGKSTIFPSIYLLHLLYTTFGRMDFVLLSKLIQWYLALYEVRVPQTGGAGYSLLGKEVAPFYVVPAIKVTKENVLKVWKLAYRQDAPDAIQKYF